MNKLKKAFTLIELIVVITILAILGTIAFLAFQGYSASARDSKRISDMNTIKTSLELFGLNSGKFPDPTSPVMITYSSGTINNLNLRQQGIFGQQNITNVSSAGKLDRLPKDPLTELEYTYSVTLNKKEFELGTILEKNEVAFSPVNITNAASKKVVSAFIKGNYNGKILKTSSGTTSYIFAVPSIINSDSTLTDINELISPVNKIAYNGFANIPPTYDGPVFEVNGAYDKKFVNPDEILVFEGPNYSDLIDPENSTTRMDLLQNIKDAYSGTDLISEGGIREIVESDPSNPTVTEENLAGIIVNSELGGNVKIVPGSGTGTSTSWKNLDNNCKLEDITIGTQVWAGCNSTLGNGLEYNNNFCFNYNGNNLWNGGLCWIGNYGDSFDSEITYFNEKGANINGDTGVDNIWGKLYTWDNSNTACPSGRRVPNNDDYNTLETFLNGGINCRTGENNCSGLGWKNHSNISKNETNNLINALKIPLSGYFISDDPTFVSRGSEALLWSTTLNNTNGYSRTFNWNNDAILLSSNNKNDALSVRCIKGNLISDGGEEENLVCTDMTETNRINLNTTLGFNYTIGEWCGLTDLDLGTKGLTSLPNEIGYLTNLQSLRLNDNQLSTLPSTMSNLTNLIELDIDTNNFLIFPDVISELTNLEGLRLYGNQLSILPSTISNLTNLTELDISDNNFTTYPSNINTLNNLLSLSLSNNGLTSLPNNISNLSNLNRLDLSGNEGLGILSKEYNTEDEYSFEGYSTEGDLIIISSEGDYSDINIDNFQEECTRVSHFDNTEWQSGWVYDYDTETWGPNDVFIWNSGDNSWNYNPDNSGGLSVLYTIGTLESNIYIPERYRVTYENGLIDRMHICEHTNCDMLQAGIGPSVFIPSGTPISINPLGITDELTDVGILEFRNFSGNIKITNIEFCE